MTVVLTTEPLRVGLGDLLDADQKGKWWLVGAAWSGDPLVDREEPISLKPAKRRKNAEGEEVLLDLARQQGMNTDVRRSVFVVLTTSEVGISVKLVPRSYTPPFP